MTKTNTNKLPSFLRNFTEAKAYLASGIRAKRQKLMEHGIIQAVPKIKLNLSTRDKFKIGSLLITCIVVYRWPVILALYVFSLAFMQAWHSIKPSEEKLAEAGLDSRQRSKLNLKQYQPVKKLIEGL